MDKIFDLLCLKSVKSISSATRAHSRCSLLPCTNFLRLAIAARSRIRSSNCDYHLFFMKIAMTWRQKNVCFNSTVWISVVFSGSFWFVAVFHNRLVLWFIAAGFFYLLDIMLGDVVRLNGGQWAEHVCLGDLTVTWWIFWNRVFKDLLNIS